MSGIAFRELSPVSFLERAAAVFAQRPAVVDGEFHCTYEQFWDRAQRLAGLLTDHGVATGDRVAVLAPNTHMLLEAHYGVPAAGAVLVAMNSRLAPAEIAYVLEHSGARLVLVDGQYQGVLDQTRAHMSDVAPGVITSDEYDARVATSPRHRVEVADERSLLAINYTSGTTGKPKGVMYHHRGAYLQALAMAYHAGMDTSSRYLWTLPMFHTNGWCFPWAVTAAGAVHHCLRGVEPGEIWENLHERGITHLCAAPTVLAMLAEHPAAAPPDHRVRVFAGGAPPWPALLSRMRELGIDVRHLYGLTETYGPAMVCEWQPEWNEHSEHDQARLVARQGIANVIAEPARVVDADGNDVAADGETSGEIVLRGNDVMLGYYRDDEATAAASIDGWFRTGDMGVLHPDGYLELRDRIKDVIISGGENIASVEVENALTEHRDVSEAAVVAEPHPKWGEVPVAYVSPRAGSTVGEQDLAEFVRDRIARFKVPHRIVFGELPKTSTGKLQKGVLRERAREETENG